MNKFINNLTAGNKQIKKERATRISKSMVMAQNALVQGLERDVMEIEDKIDNHTDLHPNHTTQLSFEKFEDAGAWVKTLQELKCNLRLKSEELKIAEATQSEWFTELKTAKAGV